MKKRWIIILLILAVLIAVGLCMIGTGNGPGSTITASPPTENSVTAPPTATELPTEPSATEPPAVTEPPTVFPTPEAPSIPAEEKPSLTFSQPQENIQPGNLRQIIGFTFPASGPDWTVPIKVAPFIQIEPNAPGELTAVGIIEIGVSGESEPGIYEVRIDIGSTEAVVNGQLIPITATNPQAVMFQRIPQIVNPDRIDSPYEEFQELPPPPDTAVAISSDSVCFVIHIKAPDNTQSQINTQTPDDNQDQGDAYIRYCSEPGSILSVRQNFETQYADLQELIGAAAGRFDLQDVVQADLTISEKESIQGLQNCASEPTAQNCSSDITIAPVAEEYFQENYNAGRGQSSSPGSGFVIAALLGSMFQEGDAFSVTVAVVQILEPIETSLGLVQPGDYRMDYWFDASGEFYAATISGVRTDGQGNVIGQVTNQQVPADPATFVNEDGTEQPGAQISVCRIFGVCSFFQLTCT